MALRCGGLEDLAARLGLYMIDICFMGISSDGCIALNRDLSGGK